MMPLSLAAAAWSGALSIVAGWGALRTRAGRPSAKVANLESAPDGPTRIVLLRPCAGAEASLEHALRSSACADAHVRLRFLVARTSDAAAPVALRIAGELADSGRDARVVETHAAAPNMKAAQLACALDLEVDRADIVAVADSDVEVSGAAFRALLAPLALCDAEATWVPAIETRARTCADGASSRVLDSSLHSFPLLAGLDRNAMVGKFFAVRRDALDAVGGFGALTAYLGEDFELSHRLHRLGMRVRSVDAIVESLASGRSWGEVIERYSRWISVVRAQRPWLLVSYPALLAATPLILVLTVAGVLTEGWVAMMAMGFTLTARWFIACLARWRAGRGARPWVGLDGLIADALLLVAFARAVTSREVRWRGVRLELSPRGVLGRGR